MRKLIILLTSVLLVLSFVACDDEIPIEDENKEVEVLEVKIGRWDVGITHIDDIKEKYVIFVDESKVGTVKEFTFIGTEYEIEYVETTDFIVGDYSIDTYKIHGLEDGEVHLLPNGKPYGVVGISSLNLDIEKTASDTLVKMKLLDELKKEINFKQYKHCDVRAGTSAISEKGGFGFYTFTWYNKSGDISLDDHLRISVNENGDVSTFWLGYNKGDRFGKLKKTVVTEKMNNAVIKKLEDIYNTDKSHLLGYKFTSEQITMYNGKPYILYHLEIKFKNRQNEEVYDTCELLVSI